MTVKSYLTLLVEREGPVGRIWFNRPEVHNAFNAEVIRELRDALRVLEKDKDIRVIVLSGKGKSFCAGADLNWMRETIGFTYEDNLRETLDMAEGLHELYSLRLPTIARVNGAAIGGGTGFLSACDIAVASADATFGLSEVKIGLVPAAISPYIYRRIGESRARQYFLTGERFDARRALEIGLVNITAVPTELDDRVEGCISSLLSSGPEALANVKELLKRVPGMPFEEAKRFTAEMIAALRISPEAREGMAAFLEKRKPRWWE